MNYVRLCSGDEGLCLDMNEEHIFFWRYMRSNVLATSHTHKTPTFAQTLTRNRELIISNRDTNTNKPCKIDAFIVIVT